MTLHHGLRERLFALEHFGIKLGLDNIRLLLEALNRPDRAFPAIHIAGTNGKGSVTAMVERGLRAAGHRTGRYTSPHLAVIEERVAVDGSPVDHATFDEVAEAVMGAVDDLRRRGLLQHPPTFFEVTTAIAFETFRRADVSVAVIEVGLGGRYDATNVVVPEVTAITSIALDHERHLGHSLAEIAYEKAGIIKPGVPVVVGPMEPAPREVIEAVAREIGAPVVPARFTEEGGTAIPLALHGLHQRDNAAVAVEVLELCTPRGLGVQRKHIVSALTQVEWPARLEWLRVPGRGDVLIDAAHNPAGARALAEYVCGTTGPLPLVLSIMKDKDVGGIVSALLPACSRIVATAASSPRALDAPALAERIRTIAPSLPLEVDEVPLSALQRCLGEGRAMVAGSIFLVGPLRALLLEQGAAPVRYPSDASLFFLA